MHEVSLFIKWALTHAKRDTIPIDAILPISRAECGKEPWHYLFGTVMAHTTKERIEERWDNHYSKSWSKSAYENATRSFKSDEYATDCQGILDAYMTSVLGEKTDINANMNYESWCIEKGSVKEIERDYVIGEAVFMQNPTSKKMTHVGWICGFDGGEPLVIEARGISYGVVVTQLSARPWTHRGLMGRKFDYSTKEVFKTENTQLKFELASPNLRGESYLMMQKALNLAGYTDENGEKLAEDGIWGKKSHGAFTALIKNHADIFGEATDARALPIAVFTSSCGKYSLALLEGENSEG